MVSRLLRHNEPRLLRSPPLWSTLRMLLAWSILLEEKNGLTRAKEPKRSSGEATCMQIFLAVSRAAICWSTLASPQQRARKLYLLIPSMISFIAELCPLVRATAQSRRMVAPLILVFFERLSPC